MFRTVKLPMMGLQVDFQLGTVYNCRYELSREEKSFGTFVPYNKLKTEKLSDCPLLRVTSK